MTRLHNKLVPLIEAALGGQGSSIPKAVFDPLLEDFAELVRKQDGRVGVHWRTITEGDLHRHVYAVRCPDQAFFLDGIKVYLSQRGIQPIGQYAAVVCATHDGEGRVTDICAPDDCATGNEMLISLHVSATLVPDGKALFNDLNGIVQAVDISVRDFSDMNQILLRAAEGLAKDNPEASALLGWMRDGKYLSFGMSLNGQRLGIMSNLRILNRVAPGLSGDLDAIGAAKKAGIEWLYLPHAQRFLYGAAQLEVVRICWKENNQLICATLLGYFSRAARHSNASQIPYLSRLWEQIRRAPELTRSAYLAREVRTLFDRIPKPVLLSISPEELLPALLAIIEMGTPEQTQVFMWTPKPGAIRLALVVMAAVRYNHQVEKNLLEAVAASGIEPVHHYNVGVGPNLLMFISTRPNGQSEYTLENLRQAVQECAITWYDRARASVRASHSGPDLPHAIEALATVPRLYTELFPPETFVSDLRVLERVRADGRPHVRLESVTDGVNIHMFTALPVPLGSLVTIVQNFDLPALKEVVVDFPGDTPVHLTTLHCTYPMSLHADALPRIAEALETVLGDLADNDPANALVLSAGLHIDAISTLITVRNHLRQLIPGASKGSITNTLNAHPQVAAALYRLFVAHHDPPSSAQETLAKKVFFEQLNDVQNLSDDRWFRSLAALILAGTRTNAFVREPGAPIAIKVNPLDLSFAPVPRPYREIFVHGRHVEGVHLRGGPIARGGLRLSNRMTDFRTEVLELMETQLVKNSIIVPNGAKGGFIIRGGAGEAFTKTEYRAFIRALLSVTDNMDGDRSVPPKGIRVAEGDADDPYLVVAADKGTATFSDLANAEAEAAGFWLGDAFASGGSNGYDHKKYGITARGTWVCVRHHFAALRIDPNKDPITMAGIGDMGGDVFGNGLLQSRTVQLIGAFNHQHVFLDPNPDPETAYRERARLFAARGGWDQYDFGKISTGGGVFSRAAKQIPIGPEAAKALGIEPSPLSGEALIRAILTAPVDLLYNGGIGTYVKAGFERHENAQDPVNNPVRVNAEDLRCKVVGEGGNLGFTQEGRIEYARGGGRINTDAIDNSGGVAMSDREVNLKILLARVPNAPDLSARNRLLSSMGEEVSAQCLADNEAQSRTLTLAGQEAEIFPSRPYRLVERLVASGHIDPEAHPDFAADRVDTLLLRPQLAVLVGHEKNRIKAALDAAVFAGHSPLGKELLSSYFPKRIVTRFGDAIGHHPLAEKIAHTGAAGRLVDRFGLFAISHLEDLIATATPVAVAHGLFAADHLLGADKLRTAIWNEVPDQGAAVRMQVALQGHLQHFAEELLRLRPVSDFSGEWLKEQRSHFVRFAKMAEQISVEAPFNALCVGKSDAMAMGLSAKNAARLCAMPVLARCGVALDAGVRRKIPLSRCLAANQAVFKLLPFLALEQQLRTPEWGTDATRALRREWLHRIILMRSRAVDTVLSSRARDLFATGEKRWCQHSGWDGITELIPRTRPGEKADPMDVILLLTRLESLIDATRT